MKLKALCSCLCFCGILGFFLFVWGPLNGIRLRSLIGFMHATRVNEEKGERQQNQKLDEIMEIVWPIIGGFRGTPFNDLRYVRSFLQTVEKSTQWKTILRVGNFNFNHLKWKDGWKHLEEVNCPVVRCRFTSNRSSAKTADALIISELKKDDLQSLIPKPLRQIWIAQHLESPYHNRLNPKLLNGLVNWTATYRQDSTFRILHSAWIPVESAGVAVEMNYGAGRRSKKVAMFVSNCQDRNGRLNYARHLSRFIQVDIYGGCGKLKCPKIFNTTIHVNPCFKLLKNNYKFYLSFENSNCIGYITEKLHINALSNDVVPIVMGARPEDYAMAAPPGSYIHVDDFKSPRHLVEYLHLLDSNDSLYNEYFQYKRRYRPIRRVEYLDVQWCQICTLLHLNDYMNRSQWHDDYEKWWNGACNASEDVTWLWKTWKGRSRTTELESTSSKLGSSHKGK